MLANAKAIALDMTLPSYCKSFRTEEHMARWTLYTVTETLNLSGPLVHHRRRSDPRDMWLRKVTINLYEDATAGPDESRRRNAGKFDACLRYLFGYVWPTEEVHLYLHTRSEGGPPVVSELHLTEVHGEMPPHWHLEFRDMYA